MSLHAACADGDIDDVRRLLKQGARVNEMDETMTTSLTPLLISAYLGHTYIVKELLAHRASVDAAMKDGVTPLHVAAQNGHMETARLLLEHRASVDAAVKDGATPLHAAAQNGHMETARLLLEHRASVDAAMKDGVTPLHVAALNGHMETARLLLEHRASVDAAMKNGATPLYIAALNSLTGVVSLLLQHGARVGAMAQDGTTPLTVAASEEIRSLLQLYLNSQQYHDQCMALLSDPATIASEIELAALVPLVTSVYDLRLLLTLVSVCELSVSSRSAVLRSAFNHVAKSKLVLDDDACVFFKLALDHCKTHAWLSHGDVLLLDRRAEKVNTEGAEWVTDLKRQMYANSWRLESHEQCLRSVVNGIKETHALVMENRAAVNAVHARVSDLQTQVIAGKKVMQQIVAQGNKLAGHVGQLQRRLVQSEENIVLVASKLQQFRTAYVSRLEQEEQNKKMKMACGLLASVVGFVFAPALKEAFDAVIDLANPIEVFNHAFEKTDIVKFLGDKTSEHVLEPLVKSKLEELMIPQDAFESVLREAVVLKHPELVEQAEARGLTVDCSADVDALRRLEPSLETEAVTMHEILGELQRAVSATVAVKADAGAASHTLGNSASRRTKNGVGEPTSESSRKTRSSWTSSDDTQFSLLNVNVPANSNQEDEKTTTVPRAQSEARPSNLSSAAAAVATPPSKTARMRSSNSAAKKRATATTPANISSNTSICFVDDIEAFPYHSAVEASVGDLSVFLLCVEATTSESNFGVAVDPTAAMAMRVTETTTTTVCAAEYAYCRGYRTIGDHFAARMQRDPSSFDRTQAVSIELLEDADADVFPLICAVDMSEGNLDLCEALCDDVPDHDQSLEVQIKVVVERARCGDVGGGKDNRNNHNNQNSNHGGDEGSRDQTDGLVYWTSVEYASQLGYVAIVMHLLKGHFQSMPRVARFEQIKRAHGRQR